MSSKSDPKCEILKKSDNWKNKHNQDVNTTNAYEFLKLLYRWIGWINISYLFEMHPLLQQ